MFQNYEHSHRCLKGNLQFERVDNYELIVLTAHNLLLLNPQIYVIYYAASFL